MSAREADGAARQNRHLEGNRLRAVRFEVTYDAAGTLVNLEIHGYPGVESLSYWSLEGLLACEAGPPVVGRSYFDGR